MPSDDDDRRDLAACAAGDVAALERLWARHAPKVNGLALRLVRRPDWAEDAVQETFVKVWKSAKTFRGDAKPGTWIASIAINEARMRLRGEGRRPAAALDPEYDVAAPEPDAEDPRLDDLRRELAALEDTEREMLLLAAQGHGYGEIAKMLDLTADQVRGRLYRARKALAERMKARGGTA
jgi:RNA polymerase sigma-70 factor (ECF subfamily)